jgi:hypothetical protein
MSFLAFLPLIGKIVDKIIPDPVAAAEAKQKAAALAMQGELAYLDADVKLAIGQMEINKEEAKDPSLFKSGWRPAVGWLCVAGFAYMAVIRPIVPWVAQVAGLNVPPMPPVDTSEIMAILMGMLGLGGMRTAERIKGKA